MKPSNPRARRPRILVLSADYAPRPWSGIGVAVSEQCRALAARGLDIHPHGPGMTPGPPVDPRTCDWLHLHSLSLAPLALNLAHRHRLPLVYTVHGLVHLELPQGRLRRYWSGWQRRVLAAGDRIVFLSRSELSAGMRFLPGVEKRGVIIPNGLHPPPAMTTPTSPNDPIVFAGRFAPTKGMTLLRELVPRLLAAHPAGVVFAGGHGDAEGYEIVAELLRNNPKRCRHTGWIERKALFRLLGRAALVLVPSSYEPFGLTALEAMAAGTPVLASDVGGLRDLAASNDGVMTLSTRCPEQWAEAALGIIGTPGRAERMGHLGRAFAARHYDIARVAARLENEVYCHRKSQGTKWTHAHGAAHC